MSEVLPQDLDAERAVLGSVIVAGSGFGDTGRCIAGDLPVRPEDFFLSAHAEIFGAMRTLADQGTPADVITLADLLRQRDQLERVGDLVYLMTLTGEVATALNAAHYAEIVAATAARRRIIDAGNRAVHLGYDERVTPQAAIDELEGLLAGMAAPLARGFVQIGATVTSELTALDERAAGGISTIGLRTGLYDLDDMTSGLEAGDLVVVMAATSAGKSSLMGTIAHHVALKEQRTVAIASLEMTTAEWVQRLFCLTADVDSQRYRKASFSDDEWDRMIKAAARLSAAPIFIDDTGGLPLVDLRARARALARTHPPTLLVVDYLQLIATPGTRHDSRTQELGTITRGLKALAKELQTVVLVGAQVNRRADERKDKRPSIGDLRETASGEQDADIILGLYRNVSLVTEEGDDAMPGNLAELLVLKQRNGPTGICRLAWNESRMQFLSLARDWEQHA